MGYYAQNKSAIYDCYYDYSEFSFWEKFHDNMCLLASSPLLEESQISPVCHK